MNAKMQPFWWFLRSPYTYPCWYNTCESCNDWTLDPELSCTLDSINKKQGDYAVKISKGAAVGSGDTFASKLSAQCAQYFGFWVRAYLPAQNRGWNVSVYKDANHYAGVDLYFISPLTKPQLRFRIYVEDSSVSAWIDINSLQWYWVEVSVAAALTRFYLDGVHKWDYAGAVAYPAVSVKVTGYKHLDASDVWLDWLRWYDTEEYPPSYPY